MPSVYLGESWEWSASALNSQLHRTCTAIRVGWWGLRSPSLRFTRQPGKGKGLGKGMEWERVEHARDLGKFRRRSLGACQRRVREGSGQRGLAQSLDLFLHLQAEQVSRWLSCSLCPDDL